MIKWFMAAATFFFVSGHAIAQEKTSANQLMIMVTCDIESEMNDIIRKYDERTLAIGDGNMVIAPTGQMLPGKMKLWVNPETGSWTISLVGPDQGDNTKACMLSSGRNFSPYVRGSKL
tara:strand:- start:633 stop:986 length:354 start_codon:yes stop_codon:yes gene_type:complete